MSEQIAARGGRIADNTSCSYNPPPLSPLAGHIGTHARAGIRAAAGAREHRRQWQWLVLAAGSKKREADDEQRAEGLGLAGILRYQLARRHGRPSWQTRLLLCCFQRGRPERAAARGPSCGHRSTAWTWTKSIRAMACLSGLELGGWGWRAEWRVHIEGGKLRRRQAKTQSQQAACCEKQRSHTPDVQLGPKNNGVIHRAPGPSRWCFAIRLKDVRSRYRYALVLNTSPKGMQQSPRLEVEISRNDRTQRHPCSEDRQSEGDRGRPLISRDDRKAPTEAPQRHARQDFVTG
jgi:hypothetical protein